MFLRRRGPNSESRTDFLVRGTCRDERDDLALTGGEPFGPCRSSRTRHGLTLAQPSAKDLAAERRLSPQRAEQRTTQAVRRTLRIDIPEGSRPQRVACVRGVGVLGDDNRRPRTTELTDLFPRETIVRNVEDDVLIRKFFLARHARRAPERDRKLKAAQQTEDGATTIDDHEPRGSGLALNGLVDL